MAVPINKVEAVIGQTLLSILLEGGAWVHSSFFCKLFVFTSYLRRRPTKNTPALRTLYRYTRE
jgi:hypothetical protein